MLTEYMSLSATNPFGHTKLMIEEILRDLEVSDNVNHIHAVDLAKVMLKRYRDYLQQQGCKVFKPTTYSLVTCAGNVKTQSDTTNNLLFGCQTWLSVLTLP